MLFFLEFIAAFCSGIFAGAAAYVSVVEQRAREAADPAVSLAAFKIIFHKAAKFQIPLLVVTVVCSTGVAVMTNQWLWLIGSGAMVFIVPFTIFVLMPLNNRLLAATDTDPNLTEMLK